MSSSCCNRAAALILPGLRVLRIVSAFFALAVLAGCVQPTTSGDTGTGPCSDRQYFNSAYQFGFNPPAGYSGPVFALPGLYTPLATLDESFVVPLLNTNRIDVELFPFAGGLSVWLDTIKTRRVLQGSLLLDSEDFTTDGGAAATLLTWSSSQSVMYEVFSERSGLIYALHSELPLLNSTIQGPDVRAALRSLCVAADIPAQADMQPADTAN